MKLCKAYLVGTPNQQAIKAAYRIFLKKVQPNVPKPNNINLALLWKHQDIIPLIEIFEEKSFLDDFDSIFSPKSDFHSIETIQRIQEALGLMKEKVPIFSNLIDLVIHTIFSFPSELAGGGSTSGAIGCIWVDMRPHWKDEDVLEFLVHETTHNLIFIDELCYTHYSSYKDLAKPENFSQSAILNKSRPIDKVFHSIIVSVEVLSFREDNFGHPTKPFLHPPTAIMIEQTNKSIESLLLKEHLLTDRSRYLLRQSKEKLKLIESNNACAV